MLVKAQITSLSVLICDSFFNFSLHHAAPLPLVCHLPPNCWGAESEWGGKEVCIRFGIAIDKTCRVERWFDISVGRRGLQAAEQLFTIFCDSFSCGQPCLPHGLYHVFPCECQPLDILFCTWSVLWARRGSAVTFDQMGAEGGLVSRTVFTEGPNSPWHSVCCPGLFLSDVSVPVSCLVGDLGKGKEC